ncbi:hypothetical protein BDK51DRAFT_31180, partial [Blyttiomyces helicus]
MRATGTTILALAAGAAAAPAPSLQKSIIAKAYRHMPIFVMHPDEKFQPSDVSVMYKNTNLADVNGNPQGTDFGFCKDPAGCPQDYLFPFNKDDWATSLFSIPKTPGWARGVATQDLNSVPLHIFFNVVNNASRVDVYYHTMYPYNEGRDGTLHTNLGHHLGDVEFSAISFPIDASGNVNDPQTVCLGRHSKTDYGFYDYATSEHLQKIGDRVKAYVALGGHGTWSKASCCNHHGPLGAVLDATGEGPQWDASNAPNLQFWCTDGVCQYEGYSGEYGLPNNSGYSNLAQSPAMPVVQLQGPGNKFEYVTP